MRCSLSVTLDNYSKPVYYTALTVLFEERKMWSRTYSQKVKGLSAEHLWEVWTDVNQWHTWQDNIEYADLDGEFAAGKSFLFKPKNGSAISIELTEVEPRRNFTDVTRFPLAKMRGTHEIIERGDELEVKTTINIDGLLSFVWRKLVAEEVANGLKVQTEKLIERTKNA
jgi:hypothetical protein